jgi:hypothetical protein
MWNHGSSNSRGVAILFSKTIDYEITETGRDNTGRKISCVVKILNKHAISIFFFRHQQNTAFRFLSSAIPLTFNVTIQRDIFTN